MKILRIHPFLSPSSGGIFTSIVQNTHFLSSRGVDTIILTGYVDALLSTSDCSWQSEFRIKSFGSSFFFSPYLYKTAKNIVLREDVTMVIIDGLWQYSGIVASRLYRDIGVPVVQFTHGQLDQYFSTEVFKHFKRSLYWSLVEKRNMQNRSLIVFTHNEELLQANSWLHGVQTNRSIIPLGISPSCENNYSQNLPSSIGSMCKLLFLGRIHPKKGLDILFKALSIVASRKEIFLEIVGPIGSLRYHRYLLSMARALGVDQFITWTPPVYGSAKWDHIRNCDVFILPTRGENFGLTIPEALSLGKPVITTNKAAIHSYITEFQAGLVSDASFQGVSFAINKFLSLSSQEAGIMSRNATELFNNVFHIDVVGSRLYNTLLEVSKSRQ